MPSRVRADLVPGAREPPNKELSLGRAHSLRGGGSVFPLRKKETKELEKGFRMTQLIPWLLGEGDRQELNLRHRTAKLMRKESLIARYQFPASICLFIHLSESTFPC